MSVAAALALLKATYPRADFPEESVRAYMRLLSDVPDDALKAAVARLCKRSTFLPSVAEIRRSVAEDATALPSPEVAWDIALRGSLRDAPEELRAAVDASGGRHAFMTTESPQVLRAQFVKDYTARRERAILIAMGAAHAGELVELPAAPVALELPPAGDNGPVPLTDEARMFLARMTRGPHQPADPDAITPVDEGTTRS